MEEITLSSAVRAPEMKGNLHKHRSYATAAVCSHNKSPKPPITRKKLAFRKQHGSNAKSKVDVAGIASAIVAIGKTVDHSNVLTTGELVNNIMTTLEQNLSALTKMMRVNSQFAAATAHLVWEHGDPRDLISCGESQQKRMYYASLITQVRFWSYELLWNDETAMCPTFSRVADLEIYDTALRSGTPDALMPYLAPALKHLSILTEDECPDVKPTVTRCDDVWLAHSAATCTNLESLALDFVLDVGPLEFARFLQKMPQLKVLRLGQEMNYVLNDSALLQIFTMPQLEILSMQYKVDYHFIDILKARSCKYPILPSIQKLNICLLDGAGPAPKKLLGTLKTLQTLEINIGNSGHNWQESMDDSVFASICTLYDLHTLIVRLEPGLDISDNDIAALASLQDLEALEMSLIPRPFTNTNNYLLVSGSIFCNTMLGLKKLDYLTLDLDREEPMVLTIEEPTLIHHILSNMTHSSFRDPDIVVDEGASFGWPTFDDWEDWIGLPTDIWLARNDHREGTMHWEPRDLSFGTVNPDEEEETGSEYDWQGDLRSEIGDEFDDDEKTKLESEGEGWQWAVKVQLANTGD